MLIHTKFFAVACWLALGMGCSNETAHCESQPEPQTSYERRPDPNLELLALRLSNGLTADQQVYERIERDINSIRLMESKLKEVHYTPRYDGRSLLIKFRKD